MIESSAPPTVCPACYESVNQPIPDGIIILSFCHAHEPDRSGVDDARVEAGTISMNEEAGGSDNAKWCALFHARTR